MHSRAGKWHTIWPNFHSCLLCSFNIWFLCCEKPKMFMTNLFSLECQIASSNKTIPWSMIVSLHLKCFCPTCPKSILNDILNIFHHGRKSVPQPLVFEWVSQKPIMGTYLTFFLFVLGFGIRSVIIWQSCDYHDMIFKVQTQRRI